MVPTAVTLFETVLKSKTYMCGKYHVNYSLNTQADVQFL